MFKKELVAAMAEESGLNLKQANAALDAFVKVLSEDLKAGNKTNIPGFGTFYVGERAERQGRNPKTGENMVIKASKSAKFKSGKTLKDMMN